MAELTEEDLAKLSPEQLRELQRQQCIFCHIIAGKVPARKVYEDELCVAVLDINPGAPGHVLLLPKEHASVLPQLPEDVIGHLGMVVKHLCRVVVQALKVDGASVLAANGVAAGQRAAHVMFHIIPRKEGDGVGLVLQERRMSDEQLHAVQQQVIVAVRKVFNSPDDALRFEGVTSADGGKQSAGDGRQPAGDGQQPKAENQEAKAEDRAPASANQSPTIEERTPDPKSRHPDAEDRGPKAAGGASLDDIANMLLGKR